MLYFASTSISPRGHCFDHNIYWLIYVHSTEHRPSELNAPVPGIPLCTEHAREPGAGTAENPYSPELIYNKCNRCVFGCAQIPLNGMRLQVGGGGGSAQEVQSEHIVLPSNWRRARCAFARTPEEDPV